MMVSSSGDVLISYDNTQEVRDMGHEFGLDYRPVQMKSTHHAEITELPIGRNLDWLAPDGRATRVHS
jgi:DNA adenine methylase